ncbi:DUF1934 domain-containing protein [Paenibacillus sp. FSL W7-1287]|uniref:DUF1934 domain-containing protein n=1 Tax=Paenibacillus sp. FSL W7-1287 TaxID=2954538 RepID=UPI0030F95922
MNYKQKIWIQLESEQDNEVVTQQMLGEWYLKDKAFYIKYTEQTDAGEVRHLLRYESNELKVSRKGAVDAEQVYRIHERREGFYSNGMINLETAAYTYQLIIKDAMEHIVLGLPKRLPFSLVWDYELYVGEQSTGRFKLRLLLKEATAI